MKNKCGLAEQSCQEEARINPIITARAVIIGFLGGGWNSYFHL